MIANFCTTLIVTSKLHWLIFLYLLFFLFRINCCLLWSLAASFGPRLNFSTSSLCLKAIEFCTSALLDSYGQTACVFWKTERLNLETEYIPCHQIQLQRKKPLLCLKYSYCQILLCIIWKHINYGFFMQNFKALAQAVWILDDF